MTYGDFAEKLSHRRIRNSEVFTRVQVLPTAVAIAFDNPPEAQSWQREGLREIPNHRGTRKMRSGIGFGAVIERVKNFVGDELNSILRTRIGEFTTRIFVFRLARLFTSSRSMR